MNTEENDTACLKTREEMHAIVDIMLDTMRELGRYPLAVGITMAHVGIVKDCGTTMEVVCNTISNKRNTVALLGAIEVLRKYTLDLITAQPLLLKDGEVVPETEEDIDEVRVEITEELAVLEDATLKDALPPKKEEQEEEEQEEEEEEEETCLTLKITPLTGGNAYSVKAAVTHRNCHSTEP